MKKLFILSLALSSLLLVGCQTKKTSEQIKKAESEALTTEINSDMGSIASEPEGNESLVAEGPYYEKDGYLWGKSKKLIDIPLEEWLGSSNYNVGIWFQREEGDKTYIYFSSGSDCGGCFVNEDDYLVVDRNTNKIIRNNLRIFNDNHVVYELFRQGNGTVTLSPDKTRAAYVNEASSGEQYVYIYDFKTETNETSTNLPYGKKIAESGAGGFFMKDYKEPSKYLYWNENGELIVNP